MVTKTITVKCPFCGSKKVSKNGHNKTGKQVYNCKNEIASAIVKSKPQVPQNSSFLIPTNPLYLALSQI